MKANPISPAAADRGGSSAGAGAYCGGASCAAAIGDALAAVSGRWAIAVMEGIHFAGGASRFRDLQRRIGAISSKELSRQLGSLVAHGVVNRMAPAPGYVCYALTGEGMALMRHMEALGEWARSRDVSGSEPAGGGASWLDPIIGGRRASR